MAHRDHNSHHHGADIVCPSCDIGPFSRNNYFTGKLMLERDFTDETRYHIDKLRHHHQRLHGWGVVCGLKVKQHEQDKCRDRFICIEPGTAIDCCGHEIIVREEECIDITQFEAIKALKKTEGELQQKPEHTLQIRICYRECPTEDIPVLYDECGCDDTKCAPNRILESYDFDVVVDPPDEKPQTFHTPKFKWENSVAIAHATRVALHDASHRLYVVTADSPSTVYQVSTDNHITITSSTQATQAVALAVSNDGAHLYVITEPANPTDPRQLHVLDTTKAGLPPIHPSSAAELGGGAAFMTVAPDNRLLALGGASGNICRWAADIDTPGTTPAAPQKLTLTANVTGLVLGNDGATGYVADTANAKILRFNATALTSGTSIALSTSAKPSSMAIVKSTASDTLVVVDQTNSKLHLVALTPTASVVGGVTLDHPPIGVVAAPGGHWAYVLEKDADSFVQAVSLHGLLQTLTVTPGKEFKVGKDSRQIIISGSGARLYIPFADDLTKPAVGGVAIVDVSEQTCEEILWRHLDGCPHCDTPECLVLATIGNYHLDDKIEDLPAQQDDASKQIARIDNRKGRRLLPSTEVLKEYIECLRDHGPGGAGPQGPPGAPGVGERGPEGPAGPGLEADLTQIVALSWEHNKRRRLVPIMDQNNHRMAEGIVIGFSKRVQFPNDIDGNPADHVFQVLVDHELLARERTADEGFAVCRCPIKGKVIAVEPKPDVSPGLISGAVATSSPSQGLAFIPDDRIRDRIMNANRTSVEFWVVLRGDFVIDESGRAVDAEFVREDLPTGDRTKGSNLGIQGGLFESWFTVELG